MCLYRIILLLLPSLSCSLTMAAYTTLSYSQILSKWRQFTKLNHQFREWNISQDSPTLVLPPNNCLGPCQYPIFEYTSDDYNQTRHSTLFLVGAFHGDQPLGSLILTNALNLIKEHGKHVIMLPVANPSGFVYGKRYEVKAGIQPSSVNEYNSVDPNRDFPYETSPDKCFQGATSRVVDYIYRKWKIHLSVTFHQGGQEISWNWGAPSKTNQLIPEENIAATIAKDMKRKGGQNSVLQMMRMKTGNMNEAIYPVSGSFQDWAYAASWDTSSSSKVNKCNAYDFRPYPVDTHQGLVFIVESGPKIIDQSRLGSEMGLYMPYNSTEKDNGFITRGLRIIQVALDVTNPRLVYQINGDYSVFSVKGCQRVHLSLEFLDGHTIQKSLNGSLHEKPTIARFPITEGIENDLFQAKYDFVCDKDWQDKGKTRFGLSRRYRGSLNISIKDYVNPFQPPMPLPLEEEYLKIQQKILLIGLTGGSVLLLFIGIYYVIYWRGQRTRSRILQMNRSTGMAITTNTEIVVHEEVEEEKEEP